MFAFLKNHPFAVEAFFESSIVLTYAVPKEQIQHMIPPCLTLDTYKDNWAFVAVAMVQTNALRPKLFPKFMGHNFFLVGYRIFVRYTNNAGKRLRGLYIIKSETNKKRMQLLGNIFTKYSYTTTDIIQTITPSGKTIQSAKSGLLVEISSTNNAISLPANSPFNDWAEARRFSGPLPFTFSYNEKTNEVLIVKGIRENWQPTPVKVIRHHVEFLTSLNLQNLQLASAFMVSNIPYSWQKGKTEIWNG